MPSLRGAGPCTSRSAGPGLASGQPRWRGYGRYRSRPDARSQRRPRSEARASMPAHVSRTLAPAPSAPPSGPERRLLAPAPPGERRHARRTLRQPGIPPPQASIGGFGLSLPLRDHHIEQLIGWMLAHGREDRDASSVALALARGLVSADAPDDAEGVRPFLRTLLADFPEVVWPLIGQAIVSDRWRSHRLGLALGDSFSFGPRTNPPLLHLPEATLFAWCHAHPDSAPAFAAGLLPVLAAPDGEERKVSFHPRLARILDEFGDREDVREAIDRNVNSFGWSGSATTYYARYEHPFAELTRHPRLAVRRWAKSMLRRLRASRERARNEEDVAIGLDLDQVNVDEQRFCQCKRAATLSVPTSPSEDAAAPVWRPGTPLART